MEQYTIGCLIRTAREQKGLSREELSEGLCSPRFLEKIEMDQVEPNILLVEILLQRLDCSPNKLEYILSNEDYKWLQAYDGFLEFVFCGREDWAGWLLPRLRKNTEENRVQEMLFYRCEALYQYYIAGDKKRAAQALVRAILETSAAALIHLSALISVEAWISLLGQVSTEVSVSPSGQMDTKKLIGIFGFVGAEVHEEGLPFHEWIKRLRMSGLDSHNKNQSCILSATEMENLLALVRVLSEVKQISSKDAITVLCWCEEYINAQITDKEEHAQISSKCAWVLSGFYIAQQQEEKAFEICDSAFEELQDYGIAYFMRPLLRQMLRCKSVYALQRKKAKYERYLNTLTRIYDTFGEAWYPQDSILYHCGRVGYFLDYEVLKGGRRSMGLTQEEMASGIFAGARSLSQIENCKSRPSKANFQKLMGKLKLQRTRVQGKVLTNSMETLKKVKELRRLVSKRKHVEMERYIRELYQELDMSLPDNQRAVRYFENVIDYAAKSRSYEDILREDYRLLSETYDVKRDLYRTPFMREAEYVNQIAILLRRIGREEESSGLYEKVLEIYRKSKVKEIYHFQFYIVMLGNLAAQKRSMELSKKVVRLCLKYGKIHMLHYDVMTYVCALEGMEGADKEYCRVMVEDVMALCGLIKNEKDLAKAQQYYEQHFNVNNMDL